MMQAARMRPDINAKIIMNYNGAQTSNPPLK